MEHDELNPEELKVALEGKPRAVGEVNATITSINVFDNESSPPVGGRALEGRLSEEQIRSMSDSKAAESTVSPVNPPPGFFGQEDFNKAVYTLQKEEPQHRWICYLAAQGNTTTEIAEITGFTTAMVAYVKKQPWAQQRIAEIQQAAGSKVVRETFQGKAAEIAQVLVDIALDKKASIVHDSQVRARAANSILDRLYGKAPETVRNADVDVNEFSVAELQAIVRSGNN